MVRYIGIDFSGAIAPWRVQNSRPTIWIATLEELRLRRLSLSSLLPVQALPGYGRPFLKLASLLAAGEFEAAAIDAPFSLPAAYLPAGGHADLLGRIRLTANGEGRDFPEGRALLSLVGRFATLSEAKPLRMTERYWAARHINVRSTLWAGARGGAPFTAACLRLLDTVSRPIWPWSAGTGILGEAFPAAQLLEWGIPYQVIRAANRPE